MNINHLKKYQTFSSVAELDQHVRGFLRRYKWELSEGNLEILTYIWRHSVKYPGVSFAKVNTIVSTTGRSRSTVIRTINRFENMNLIKRVATIRPNGKRGVNLLLFQPQEAFLTPCDDTLPDTAVDTVPVEAEFTSPNGSTPEFHKEAENKQGEKQSLKTKKIEGRAGFRFDMDYTFLPSYIPTSFVEEAKPFFTPVEVDRVWECIYRAYKREQMHQSIEAYLEGITRTFKQAIFLYKQGKIKKEFCGYLYSCVLESLRQEKRRETIQCSGSVYYNWLDEA
ncbi:hypothetical protein N780_08660 [Pontibacillus chungwhensis BH030062]|uniref:Uncharacterized protein n=1 Tax=Pontibacillus chungwhensis BH030062 TaxID=1385513 RepID=A0A0A2VCD4_9BACI|nr:hypothetical protein [Pontibacillus chungwhensis]KGP91325.1 hypothetical protein N780_08660 [Pontibacillus chungwhensis BH030062]